jgi:hypothetical protein
LTALEHAIKVIDNDALPSQRNLIMASRTPTIQPDTEEAKALRTIAENNAAIDGIIAALNEEGQPDPRE